MHPFAQRTLILLLAALAFAPAHAATTWQKLNKNNWNNGFQNLPATVLKLTTGSQSWTTPHDSLATNCGAVLAKGILYGIEQDGAGTYGTTTDDAVKIVAYNAASGQRLWKSRALTVGMAVAYGSTSSPTVDPASGMLYFGSGDRIHKLNAATGDVVTSTRLTQANTKNSATTYEIINSSPAVGGNMLFIETYGGYPPTEKQIVALNKNTLAVAWAVKEGGMGNGTPCYVDTGTSQTVYTASRYGVSAYDAASGKVRWKSTALGANSWSMAYDIAASLVYDSGNLYVTSEGFGGGANGEILSVNAATGVKNWAQAAKIEWVSVPPVVVGDKVYVKGGASHTLWCLNTATGTTAGGGWSKVLGGGAYASYGNGLVAAKDRIYTTDGTRLMILDPANGAVLHALADDYYAGMIALGEHGAVFVHASDTVRAFGPVAAASNPRGFGTPIILTRDGSGVLAHMSRSSAGQLAWTPQQKLALIYWTGDADAPASLADPNHVMLREWTAKGNWGAPIQVNHTVATATAEPGGRHPALVVRADGRLLTAWHDARNCLASYNYINNLEIYGNPRPAGGSFGASDIRLTQTTSGSAGDNSYSPKLANLPGGRAALAWYDFTWDASKSDVAVKISDTAGSFGSPALTGILRTDADFRATGDASASFSSPAIAADDNGILNIVWASGAEGGPSVSNLYAGRIDPLAKTWLEAGRLATSAGGAADPAKLVADPTTGDVWLIYTDLGTYGNEEIMLRHRAQGAASFDAPVRLTNATGQQHHPAAAVDSYGRIHFVYVDETGTPAIRYRVYTPATGAISAAANLSGTLSGSWRQPAIVLDPQDNVYVVWGNEVTGAMPLAGLYFVMNAPPANAARGWRAYE